jgi:hypothetical protein
LGWGLGSSLLLRWGGWSLLQSQTHTHTIEIAERHYTRMAGEMYLSLMNGLFLILMLLAVCGCGLQAQLI